MAIEQTCAPTREWFNGKYNILTAGYRNVDPFSRAVQIFKTLDSDCQLNRELTISVPLTLYVLHSQDAAPVREPKTTMRTPSRHSFVQYTGTPFCGG